MSKFQHFYLHNACAQAYNKVIYQLQRLPFVGKHVPHSLYQLNTDKTLLISVGVFFLIIKSLFLKSLYFAMILGVSFFIGDILKTDQRSFATIAQQVLISFSLLAGTIMRSELMDSTSDNILAARIFRLPLKGYLLTKYLNQESLHRLIYFLVFWIVSGLFKLSIWQVLAFTLLITGLNTLFRYLFLFVYHLKGDKLQQRIDFALTIVAALLLTIGLAWIFTGIMPQTDWAFGPVAGLLGVVIGAFAIFRLIRIPNLDHLGLKHLRLDQLKTLDAFNAQEVQVKLKDGDLSRYQAETAETRSSQGVVWLNHLFYTRVNDYLSKNLRLKKYGLLILFVIIHVALYFSKYQFHSKDIWRTVVPFSLLGGYIFYSSEHFTKFCFYQLDRKMLKYPFYRQPNHLMTSLFTRFKQVAKLHTPLLLIVEIGFLSVYLFTGGRNIAELALIMLIQAILMAFFSFHYLILYYLIQPFTESMETKSTLYSGINMAIYFIAINVGDDIAKLSSHFMIYMLIFMLVYIIAGLIAVYYFSPKTFKLK